MKRPALVQEEDSSSNSKPVLVVDKVGIIGSALALELSKDLLVVLVSDTVRKENSNIINVAYSKKFPEIPDNNYSYIIVLGSDIGTIKSVPSFIKKARADDSNFIFATYLLSLPKEVESVLTEYKKTKVILYGDIFGEGDGSAFDNEIKTFLLQAKKNRKIQVLGEGLKKVFPVNFDDLVSGIIKVVFGTTSNSKLFYLFPKYPITLISLAHLIQKKDPEVIIDLKSSGADKEKDFEEKQDGEYLLPDDYPYQSKIKEIDIEVKTDDSRAKTLDVSDQKKLYQKKENTVKKYLYPTFLCIFLILLPFLSSSFLFLFGFINLNNAKTSMEKGDLKSAQTSVESSINLFNLSGYSFKVLAMEAGIIGIDDLANAFSKDIESAKIISKAVDNLIKAFDLLEKVFAGKSINPDEDVVYSTSLIKESLALFKELEVQNYIPEQFRKKIEGYNSLVSLISNVQDTLPNILDAEKKKKYLILFQNNMELRPGGGFIGSYGILDLNKGKVENFSIHDVYEADGQLKGHIEPPYPIRRYLPSAHWYLRDSNFNLDFVSAASSAAFFLFQETGQSVDGVIGIDVSFVKSLVSVLEPIYVPEYKETVTSDNFYSLTQAHSEKDFFPSSTQKKDFLTFLYKAINNKISSEKKLHYLTILNSIEDSILKKHILFAFANPQVQRTFTTSGLSSSLWDGRKQANPSTNDFIGISEANLGVNKANYFVGRSVSYRVQMRDDGTILSKLSLSLKNDSNKWPGGDYKNYIRFILPKGAILNAITIDGSSQKVIKAVTDPLVYESKNFKPPTELEVDSTNEADKVVYGFLQTISSGKFKKIDIEYSLAQKISPKDPLISYSLKIFKQPGTENYPVDFSFSYPSAFKILSMSKKLKDQNQSVSFQEILSQDREIKIDLTQK